MKILAFDTSTAKCSVAASNGARVSARNKICHREHNRVLFELINEVLAETHLALKDLDAIAYGRGPGTFIGVRITVATAQAFGYACAVPLIGLSGLAVLAQQAYEAHATPRVLALLDARKGEVYYGDYQCDANGVTMVHEGVTVASQIPKLQEYAGIGWGSGFADDAVVQAMPNMEILNQEASPDAEVMLRLTKSYAQGEVLNTDVATAQPVYLRDKIADIPKHL